MNNMPMYQLAALWHWKAIDAFFLVSFH